MTEYLEEPNWRGEDEVEVESRPMPPISRAAYELLEKAQVKVAALDVLLPMPGDPSQFIVEASIFMGPGRYWFIKGNDHQKFNNADQAMYYVVEMAEARRHALLNAEAEKLFNTDIA